MPRIVLSPHIYPGTITGDPNMLTQRMEAITYRWDLSWGWKMQGLDTTSDVSWSGRKHITVAARLLMSASVVAVLPAAAGLLTVHWARALFPVQQVLLCIAAYSQRIPMPCLLCRELAYLLCLLLSVR